MVGPRPRAVMVGPRPRVLLTPPLGKWLSTNKKVIDKKVLICTDVTEIECMGKYALKI